jgi:hypothetical protein
VAGARGLLQRLFGTAFRDGTSEHRSFLVYRNYLYLKLAIALGAASAIVYAWHDPQHGPSGNTWLGYTLGTIGAVLIFWLAWFGVRKRRFRQGRGQAQAWTSAHVYLGLSLLIVATLHTGFGFGWNIHTFAYALMVLVIVSGFYGVIVYATLPARITANRDQMGFDAMIAEIARLDEAALALADKVDPETHAVVARSVARVKVGGSIWEQLTGDYAAPEERTDLDQFFNLKKTQLASTPAVAPQRAEPVAAPAKSRRQVTIMFVAGQIFDAGRDPRGESLQKVLQTIAQRKMLVERINRDITLRARLNIWLYVHVPLTVGLLAALIVHIVSVFLYW